MPNGLIHRPPEGGIAIIWGLGTMGQWQEDGRDKERGEEGFEMFLLQRHFSLLFGQGARVHNADCSSRALAEPSLSAGPPGAARWAVAVLRQPQNKGSPHAQFWPRYCHFDGPWQGLQVH